MPKTRLILLWLWVISAAGVTLFAAFAFTGGAPGGMGLAITGLLVIAATLALRLRQNP